MLHVSINKNNYLQFIISRGYPPRLHEKFFLISMIGFPPSWPNPWRQQRQLWFWPQIVYVHHVDQLRWKHWCLSVNPSSYEYYHRRRLNIHLGQFETAQSLQNITGSFKYSIQGTSRSMSIPTNLFGQIDWHSHIHTRTCTRTQGGKARASCPGRDCRYCEGFPPRCCLLTAHTLSLTPPAPAPALALRLPLPFSPAVAPGRRHRRKAMARSWSLRRETSPLSPRGE